MVQKTDADGVKFKEAHIVINGIPLSGPAAITVRMAVDEFAEHIAADGCGDDERGKSIAAGYLTACGEIRAAMYRQEGNK